MRCAVPSGLWSHFRASYFSDPSIRAHEIAIHGVPLTGGPRGNSCQYFPDRARDDGAPGHSEALVLPRPASRRNFLCRRERHYAVAAYRARDCPRLPRRGGRRARVCEPRNSLRLIISRSVVADITTNRGASLLAQVSEEPDQPRAVDPHLPKQIE